MGFASGAPAWLAFLAAAGVASLSLLAYRRPVVPLSTFQRGVLVGMRALSLAAITLVLFRPVVPVSPAAMSGLVVPVAIDVSRSMGITDADGTTRLAAAVALVRSTIVPGLPKHAKVEIFGVGNGVKPVTALDTLTPDASKTDLTGALSALRDRYRGQAVGGIVLLSDGADTGRGDEEGSGGGPPVLAVGIGSPEGPADREIAGITAGDPRLDRASVDLHVSARSRGFDRTPFELRVLANGQVVDTRRVTPRDGVPIEEVFAVYPDPALATVYTAEISAVRSDALTENDRRSVVVNPAGRRRRILVLAGAPGYDYSFLVRALGQDPSLEIDSVVRKGKNDRNVDTFIVQAGASRGQLLTSGFPASRDALAAYDAIVIGNIEGSFFTTAQLAMAAAFVGERGGGLLVLGGRSFDQRLNGTALEEVLPVESTERTGNAMSPMAEGDRSRDTIALTPGGQNHPIMRLGSSPEESRALWASLPALAFNTPVGGPRAGASVLAVTTASSGAVLPVVVVQRYGRGRSMVFAGEASWRWRMMLPATDRRYERFWRQAARWLTAEAPDPVSLTLPANPEPGDAVAIDVDVRDAASVPAADAMLSGTATAPDGRAVPLRFRASAAGRFVADTSFDVSGLYRVHVEGRRGAASLGEAERWMYVGASAREFADPRLNEPLLRRLARQSGGHYARAEDASAIVSKLQTPAPSGAPPERRDLWHQPWIFVLVIVVLAAEWTLRRMWGFR